MRLRRFLALIVLVMPAVGAADLDRAMPGGQEELLSQMLGRGTTLPGNCRFTGGGVQSTVVVAEYACGDHTVVVELRAVGDAPANGPHTQQFAIAVRSGTPPPGLLDTLATRIRAGEAEVEWTAVSSLRGQVFGRRFGPLALAGCAGAILLIALIVQYVVASRWDAGGRLEPHPQTSRDRLIVLAMLGLVAVFLFTRLTFLTRLPAYVDESVHLQWARAFLDPHLVAEFSVGKWLPVRVMAIFLLLPIDPLFAARLGSVAMGLATMVGCILVNRELYSATEGLFAGIVYTLLPYALLYDRLALADIYLVAFGTWAVYCSLRAVRIQPPAAVMGMCVCVYGAILSKPTAGLFLVVPILVSVVLIGRGYRVAYLKRVLPTLLGGVALLVFLVWAGYGTGLLTSQSAFEGRRQLADILVPNIEELSGWFTVLLTPPLALVTLLAGVGALIAGLAGARAEAFLACLLALSVLPFALVSKTWYPSYLLFAVVPISLLLGRAIVVSSKAVSHLAGNLNADLVLPIRRGGYIVAALLLVGATVSLDLAIVTRPQDAALPSIDSRRFITGGLSGYGLPELAAYLRAQGQTGSLNVVRFDLVQPPKDGLDVYLSATEAIRLHTIDHLDARAAAQIATWAKTRRTLFVTNPEAEESMGISAAAYIPGAVRVWSFVRPGAQTRLEVWEVQRKG